MSSDFDDLPPLEDISEIPQYSSALDCQQKKGIVKTKADKKEYLEVDENYHVNSVEKLLKPKQNNQNVKKGNVSSFCKSGDGAKQEVTNNKPLQPSSFCGFSKGFLSGQKSDSKKQKPIKPLSKKNEIVNVSAKPEVDSKIFPEVQESLRKQTPLLQSKDWINDDLLQQIERNPELSQYLSNPRISELLPMMTKDPQRAKQAIEKSPELKEFFIEFAGLLGQHFTKLGESQSNAGSKINDETKISNDDDDIEQKKINKLLNDVDVSKLLKDKEVQQLILLIKKNPERGQWVMKTANPSLRIKIDKLIECGFLAVG